MKMVRLSIDMYKFKHTVIFTLTSAIFYLFSPVSAKDDDAHFVL